MRKKPNPTVELKRKFVINERIQGDVFRLIDDQGKQIDILSKQAALEYALKAEVDLILITPNAKPPVVKAIDFNKFIYIEEKRERENKKGQKKIGTKDVQLSLFIGSHDLERLKKRASEFLLEGNQVRVRLQLRGRELSKKDRAFDLMRSFIGSLDTAKVAREPEFQGKVLTAIIFSSK